MLVSCRLCAKAISPRAPFCPGCGEPDPAHDCEVKEPEWEESTNSPIIGPTVALAGAYMCGAIAAIITWRFTATLFEKPAGPIHVQESSAAPQIAMLLALGLAGALAFVCLKLHTILKADGE